MITGLEGSAGIAVAAAVAEIFLELNGAELQTTDEEIVAVFLAIAAGEVSRQEVEQWFAQRVVFKQVIELDGFNSERYSLISAPSLLGPAALRAGIPKGKARR